MSKRLDKQYKPVNLQSPFTNTTQKSHLVDIFSFVARTFPDVPHPFTR